MKKTLRTLFFLSLFGISVQLVLTSSSNGRAFGASSGNTGAPGESTTCRNCHGTGFGISVSMVLKDSAGVSVTKYKPGELYTLDFTVNATGASRYGFQVVSLKTNNQGVNGFITPSANTRLVNLANGRQYAEHNGVSVTNSFSTKWTAPASGTGTITFYGGGAAVNNNGGTRGDGGNTTSLTIPENTFVGINETSLENVLTVYPNPATDYITINSLLNKNTNGLLNILNLSGQIVLSKNLNLGSKSKEDVELSQLPRGIYMLSIQQGERSLRKKIILN